NDPPGKDSGGAGLAGGGDELVAVAGRLDREEERARLGRPRVVRDRGEDEVGRRAADQRRRAGVAQHVGQAGAGHQSAGPRRRATRRRALRLRGLADSSAGPAVTALRVTGSSVGWRPHWQIGRRGGQTQGLAWAATYCFTIRSSSEWKEITARR